MNSVMYRNIVRFVLLILVQALVLNHINFLGYINPYIYILFIFLFPVKGSRSLFILLSFFLGLIMDLFLDTGGIHAAACVSIAYIRPVVLKFCFGTVYEYQTIKFNTVDFISKLSYFTILTLIHHFILLVTIIFSRKTK